MTLTLLLLTAFQVYWLTKLYDEEYSNIKLNTNVLFRDCIYKLQVERFKKDTLFGKLPGENLFTIDMVNILKARMEDTSIAIGKAKKKIIITINSHVDSFISDGLPPKNILNDKFIMRKETIGPDFVRSLHDSSRLHDSIPISLLDSAYRRCLSDAGLHLAYRVTRVNLKQDTLKCEGAFCTSTVPMGLFGVIGYRASFKQPFFRIINSISLQFLFSFIMISLTLVSFIFIYRSLLQQKRLADIKNEFINNITHELKTPISTVSVAIEAIKNFNAAKDPQRTTEYLNIADNELKRLTLLVDKVLKLSMFEQDKVDMKLEIVDLNTLITDGIASMKLQFEKYKANVTTEFSNGDHLILADRIHITGVLYNLLDNALKYSTEPPEIMICISKKAGDILLSIADNGKGIPSELKERIFEKFFRVPHGDAYDARGYGLGLSYVQHVIKQHKGSIMVESELGKGSNFIITIPAFNG